jgi:hypothetical protein
VSGSSCFKVFAASSDGSIMRRVIAIAVSGLNLAGCSSFSPRPPTLQIQLESTPPGADARTSMGQGCKTPCAVNVPIPETDFAVSYTLNDFHPITVPVRVSGSPAGFLSPGTTRIDPNPVVAELQSVAPPPKPARTPMRPKKPTKPKDIAGAPPAAGSTLPNPGQPSPPPPTSSTR